MQAGEERTALGLLTTQQTNAKVFENKIKKKA